MIPVLHQDRGIVVCLKPPGVLSQDGSGETLPSMLREQLGCGIYPVHRLDREVGGVMVYAKNSRAAAMLSAAIARGEFQKGYLCLTKGCPDPGEGVYRDLLLHDRSRNKSFVVQRKRGGVKEASLAYRVLGSKDGVSLVEARLHTGRTHQIRVQFSSRGMPLVGDGRYGGGHPPIGLWSYSLSFPSDTGDRMAFRRLPEGELWLPFAQAFSALSPAP